jgi:hypothetical protein
MSPIAQVRSTNASRHGRHAIQRARSVADASRLRHAAVVLPRGVHRTRVSEIRAAPGRAAGLTAPPGPFAIAERLVAVRPSGFG